MPSGVSFRAPPGQPTGDADDRGLCSDVMCVLSGRVVGAAAHPSRIALGAMARLLETQGASWKARGPVQVTLELWLVRCVFGIPLAIIILWSCNFL